MKKRPRPANLKGFLFVADAIVPCKVCGAPEGVPCEEFGDNKKLRRGAVHFNRRLARLLLTATAPMKREALEAAAVKELRKYLREKAKEARA